MYKLTGIVIVVGDLQQISDKFSKRDFVVSDTSQMYPQDISFQVVNDKCNLLDSISVGDTVEVSFNLNGRSWESPQGEVKFFNTLNAWRIEKTSKPKEQQKTSTEDTQPEIIDNADDDLPF